MRFGNFFSNNAICTAHSCFVAYAVIGFGGRLAALGSAQNTHAHSADADAATAHRQQSVTTANGAAQRVVIGRSSVGLVAALAGSLT